MDITIFINWFINEVVKLFTSIFSILDSIEFSGTSILRFSVSLLVITTLIPIILTLPNSSKTFGGYYGRRERAIAKKEKQNARSKNEK